MRRYFTRISSRARIAAAIGGLILLAGAATPVFADHGSWTYHSYKFTDLGSIYTAYSRMDSSNYVDYTYAEVFIWRQSDPNNPLQDWDACLDEENCKDERTSTFGWSAGTSQVQSVTCAFDGTHQLGLLGYPGEEYWCIHFHVLNL